MRSLFVVISLIFITTVFWACGGSETSEGETETPTPIIRLFYYGQTEPPADPHKIYSATSTDGIIFTEESGTRFEYDAITDPDVFFDGTQYIMFSCVESSVIKSTSATANGTFVEDSSFEWDDGGTFSTIKIGDTYKAFYAGLEGEGGITVATYDPVTGDLTAEGVALANPHGDGGISDPSVIELADGTYLMFYKYYPSPGSLPSEHQIYTAISTDGSTWTATMNLVRDQASVPGAVRVGDTIYLYFVDGSGIEDTLWVGISEDNGDTFTFSETTFENSVESEQVDPVALVYE